MRTLVHEILEKTQSTRGDSPALRVMKDGVWHTTTWHTYAADVRRAAKALIALGAQPQKGVAIIGSNRPEWLVASVGATLAGALPAGIYATNSAEQVRYITKHCEARVAFGDTADQIAKYISEAEHTPDLKVVVQMLGAPVATSSTSSVRVLSWSDFLALGDGVADADLKARLAAQKPDDPCTLIYTSGTTGDPKAVIVTHRNMIWSVDACVRTLGFNAEDVGFSYLPLSHITEQMASIHVPMATGMVIHFAESMEKLAANLADVQPTFFVGVPRVWEKMNAKVLQSIATAPAVRKKLVAWARDLGLRVGYAEQRGEARPLLFPIAKRLVLDKVRARLGLSRARVCITSAAPISKETLEAFLSFGIPLLEIYGMSECGPATYSTPAELRTGKVGRCVAGGELKIASDGEICMRGPHVFPGYFKDEAATACTIDDDGWLHSGDIGTIDDDGYLQITDRKKDLIITAGGENVAPQLIEGFLKAIPGIAHAVVIGDRRRYLSALLTLDPERVATEAEAAKSPARTVDEAARCEVFRAHIERAIEGINSRLARVQTIKRFTLLAKELSIGSGDLTPTMKIKRRAVNERFNAEIEAMYADGHGTAGESASPAIS